MTKEGLIQYIQKDRFFGAVECSARVPEHLKGKFQEMCPVFKNVNVSRDDIGPTMKKYAEEEGVMDQPRGSLIGSYFGEKVLLITPLLKWFLREGLKVTDIFSVMELKPNACLRHLAEEATYHRSAADSDPAQATKGELFKLLGFWTSTTT